jgi:hypothetical protein
METTPNRRRSQRLFLQVRVILEGKLGNQKPFSEEAQTVVVNAHGALIEVGVALDQGQTVALKNKVTGETIECTVKLVSAAPAGKFSTAFEFAHPSPDFWRISFPPDDWASRNSDPKKPG